MSSSLFEVLSLAARYLFSLMGVIIVLRSFAWLLAERSERHRVLRTLPDAGTIGELVVLEGSEELPAGLSIPVPWEGVLGSVRSCDIVVPCPGVRKRHLTFSWETGTGLTILPCSGCEAQVDGVTLNVRTREKDARPMVHGSFLKVGSALLRLRVFAGLDTAEPTEEDIAFWTEVFETHRRVITGAKKPKTRAQIVKWLRDPYLDSSAYRLWGNGVALPCVWFVLAGIVYCHQNKDI